MLYHWAAVAHRHAFLNNYHMWIHLHITKRENSNCSVHNILALSNDAMAMQPAEDIQLLPHCILCRPYFLQFLSRIPCPSAQYLVWCQMLYLIDNQLPYRLWPSFHVPQHYHNRKASFKNLAVQSASIIINTECASNSIRGNPDLGIDWGME